MLLDTHLLLWILDGQLPDELAKELEAADTLAYSDASIWEIAIKVGLNRLNRAFLNAPALLRSVGIRQIPISEIHLLTVVDLPHLHRDPFDRLLVATARAEGLTLVTVDATLGSYGSSVRVAPQR